MKIIEQRVLTTIKPDDEKLFELKKKYLDYRGHKFNIHNKIIGKKALRIKVEKSDMTSDVITVLDIAKHVSKIAVVSLDIKQAQSSVKTTISEALSDEYKIISFDKNEVVIAKQN